MTSEEVRARLPEGARFADVIDAVYRAYAEARGSGATATKTPSYMQHLGLLDRVFPGARTSISCGTAATRALSFLAMTRKPRFNLGRPRRLAEFACAWRSRWRARSGSVKRVGPGRYLELRYEDLVAEPEERLREVCAFLGLDFEPGCSSTTGTSIPRGSGITRALPSRHGATCAGGGTR